VRDPGMVGIMGLASVIQKATQVAFKAIGDIPLVCTYTSVGTPNYNTTTGVTSSFDEECSGVKVLFEDYNVREVQESNGAVLNTDKKLSIAALDITSEFGGLLIPKASDFVTTESEAKWVVQKTNIDSAQALWILQCRKSA